MPIRTDASVQPVVTDAITFGPCLATDHHRPSSQWLQILPHLFKTVHWTDIHIYGLVSWFWLNLDHYLSLGRGAPWLRGLPRIPQRGALLLHANSLQHAKSIHLSSLLPRPPPSISQCVVIFVCSPLFTPVKKTILSFCHMFSPPIPLLSLLLLCLPSQIFKPLPI